MFLGGIVPKELLSTPEEWHSFVIGFFSWFTGQKMWQQDEDLKDMVIGELWYYGLGRGSFIGLLVTGGLILWKVL